MVSSPLVAVTRDAGTRLVIEHGDGGLVVGFPIKVVHGDAGVETARTAAVASRPQPVRGS